MSDVRIRMGIAKWIAPQDPTYSSADNNDPSKIEVLVPLEGQGYDGPVNFASQWGQTNGLGEFTIAESAGGLTYSYSNVPSGYEFLGIWSEGSGDSLFYWTVHGPIGPSNFSRTTHTSGGSFEVTAFAVIREISNTPTTYTVNIGNNAGGSVSGGGTYNEYTTAAIRATPSAGYEFVRWVQGSDSSGTTASPHSAFVHTVTSNVSFYAVFKEEITIDGTVQLGVIEWIGSDADFTYTDPSHNPYQTLLPNFQVGDNSDIEIKETPTAAGLNGPQSSSSGWGTLSGFGEYDNSSTITYSYSNPPAGYEFLGWFERDSFGILTRHNDTNASQLSRTFDPSDASAVALWDSWALSGQNWRVFHYAVIREIPAVTYTVKMSVSGAGSTTSGGTFNQGATYTWSATPSAGYQFVRWERILGTAISMYESSGGTLVTTNTSFTHTVNEDVSFLAIFEPIPIEYSLQVSAGDGGSVSGATSGSYEEGTSLTLTAVPSSGYQFLNWTNTTGAFQSAVNPLSITMNGNKQYVAVFQLSNTTSFSTGEMVWHNGVQKQIASINGTVITFTDGSTTGAAGVSSDPPNNTSFRIGQLVWHMGAQKEIAYINGTVITFTDGSVSGHSSVSESEPLPEQGAVSIRNDVGRHIYDLGTKEIPGAEDFFLLSTVESDNSKSARRTKFKNMSTALMSDMGQSKNGISTGGFLTQNYPQLIGGPKTFLSDDFLKIQRTNGTLGGLVDGQVYNIWEYVNAASSGDNLGNHVATENLKMGSYFITHSGGSQQGIKFGNDGSVGIGFDGAFNWDPTSQYPFTVKGSKAGNGYLVGFAQEASGVSTLRLTGAAETTSQNFIDGDIGGSLKFNIDYKGGAHFKDNLVVGKAITGGNGKFLLGATGDLTLNGSTTTQALTVKKNATFTSSASFSAAATFGGATTFSNTATFNKATTFKESATFSKSTVFNESPVFNKNITLASGATIVDADGQSAGANPGQGLQRDTDGNLKIKFGAHFNASVGGAHCGLEFDDNGGLRLSTQESTCSQGNFHAVISHPQPGADREGGHITLKKHSTGTGNDYIIDSFRDIDNTYWSLHPQDITTSKGYSKDTANSASKTAGRDVLRIGHDNSKVLGLYVGETMIVTNQHMRIADGNGHACLYAGSGKHGTMASNGTDSSVNGHFVFRTATDTNDLSKGYITMAKIASNGMWTLGTAVSSDRRLKKDIKKLDSGELLKKALKLKPSSFKKKIQNKENKTSFGLIAQEVQKIMPEIVSVMKEEIESGGLKNTLSICYEQIIPVLCGAIQEQQKQIEELKKDVKKLKS